MIRLCYELSLKIGTDPLFPLEYIYFKISNDDIIPILEN
jgi:hypothetical protein